MAAGTPLQPLDPANRLLSTPALEVLQRVVTSETALNVTGNFWQADVGLESEALPEVPQDANITLHFNSGVKPELLQEALQLRVVSSAAGSTAGQQSTSVPVSVSHCTPPDQEDHPGLAEVG